MIKVRIIKSGFKIARTHKLRAFFMVLSVMIGIAALTIIISIGNGTQQKVISRMQKLFSSNTIMVVSGAARMQGMQAHMSPTTTLKVSDIEDITARTCNILNWDAVQMSLDKSAIFNGQNAIVNVYGQMPSAESVWNLDVTEGRFFTEAENTGLSRVAVIAPNVQKELFGNSDPINQQIEIEGIPFQVIGMIGPRGIDPHGINQDDEIIIPLNTLLKRILNGNYLMLAKLLVSEKSSINSTAVQITQIIRERHNINANENDDFMVVTPDAVKAMIQKANKMFNIYLPIISIVSLIVGCIVIINLMLLSVNERVKEIGLRKALGAKSKDILYQFLIESTSITISGGIFGIVIGLLLVSQITKMMHIPFIISWSAITGCFITSSIIGITAGILPAKKAAGMQPVNALK
jgi:putative ABC transport system permease protein